MTQAPAIAHDLKNKIKKSKNETRLNVTTYIYFQPYHKLDIVCST
jgi:hypothetical protein